MLWILVAILGCLGIARSVQAEPVTPEDAVTPAELCGSGLTAIQRLPKVRVVIFDPISNSFGFMACSPDQKKGDGTTASNLDRLDNQRLALTTQKIRLLILPYNPTDGDLILEKADGEGVEFQDIVGGLPPATKKPTEETTKTTEEETTKKEDKPDKPELANPQLDSRVNRSKRGMDGLSERALEEAESNAEPYSNLAALDLRWEDYSQAADKVIEELQRLHTQERCIAGTLQEEPLRFTRALTKDSAEDKTPFSLDHDVTLEEFRKEAYRRLTLVGESFYRPCQGSEDAGFRGDILAFEHFAGQQAVAIQTLKRQTQKISESVRKLPGWMPSEVSPKAWMDYLGSMRDFVDQMDEFNASLASDLQKILQSAAQFRTDQARFETALNSPAMHVQRFNYNPLGDGKSITLAVHRGPKQPDDAPNVPTRRNQIELKSAPVYALRFGVGLVASQLKDPVFQGLPLEGTTSSGGSGGNSGGSGGTGGDGSGSGNGNSGGGQAPKNTLVFKEEGNGRILPGMFLHHYWWRRSPLLDPTPFERWMPTFSLGIPVSEAGLFTQFFLGLDWELIPGFEVNAGYHFGKVNSLAEGHHVGEVLPTGVPVSSFEKKRFDSALYFGIVVNRDAFDQIFGKK
jgi:hypothetical protein